MELNKIWNESNEVTLKEHIDDKSIDIVLTSPFYNSTNNSRTLTNNNSKGYPSCRYDEFVDNMSFEDYNAYILRLFEGFDRVLKNNGVVLWNISYGAANPDGMFQNINEIVTKSNFSIADVIIWKKKSALPNNISPNRLTRITEYVFVMARKSELDTFFMNKKKISVSAGGWNIYENIFNFVVANNNDEVCPYNKATYSTDLCYKLLNMYAPSNAVVYDPFMGSGTTALACKNMDLNYIGSELSKNQVEWAENRLMTGKGRTNETHDDNALF